MCIRARGAETGEVPHEQTSVGDTEEDLEWQFLCGKAHMEADEERQGRTPETDAGEPEGEESGLRGEDKATQRVDSEGSGECDPKTAHRVDRGGIIRNYYQVGGSKEAAP